MVINGVDGDRGGVSWWTSSLISYSMLDTRMLFAFMFVGTRKERKKKRFVGQEFRDLCSLRVSLETIYLIFNTRFLNCLFRKKNIIINTLSKLSRISSIFLR